MMRTRLAAALILATAISPAMAQEQIPTGQAYAPITLDESRMARLLNVIDSISMPATAHRQVMAILQQLEQEAQQEKYRSSRPPAAPKPDQP